MNFMIQTAIAVLLMMSLVSMASATDNLPPEVPPNTRGRAAGSRGCELGAASREMPALMLLVPPQNPAKTTNTRPMFAWYIRDATPQPMIFRLYQYQSDQQSLKRIWEKQDPTFVSQAGITVFSLPDEAPALTVGQRYLWQVELICNPDRPSSNLFAEAELQVISPQSLSAPNATDRPAAQARAYWEAELWQDALTAVFQASEADREAIAFLLQQTTSNPIEQEQLEESSIHRIP
jgi:Domain of Unknown Function (DUF928)